jgi:hypothetical protein
MTDLPLSPDKEAAEWRTILTIANNNNFPTHIIKKLKTKIDTKTPTKDNQNRKWATFTNYSAKIR